MDEFSKLFLRLSESKAALEQAFYRSLDSSVIRSGIVHGPARKIWQELGEGRHFQCFKVPGRSGLDLCVHLAKPVFLDGETRLRRTWKDDINRLRSLRHPLIPPMEVMDDTEFFAYVQPYGERDRALDAALKLVWDDLQRNLAGLGLELDDYPQLRSCHGHPFIVDYSDLRRLSTHR